MMGKAVVSPAVSTISWEDTLVLGLADAAAPRRPDAVGLRLRPGPWPFHEHQGGQHLADRVGVRGVAAGELFDGEALALAEGLHELGGDLPQRVSGGRVAVAHPQIPLIPPGI